MGIHENVWACMGMHDMRVYGLARACMGMHDLIVYGRAWACMGMHDLRVYGRAWRAWKCIGICMSGFMRVVKSANSRA